MEDIPKLIDRSRFCDDRGYFENVQLNYPDCNNFKGKRVYTCSNFQQGLVRGFHFHELESKIFICIQGAARFILLKDCRLSEAAACADPYKFIISDKKEKAIYIPANYANGWQSLTADTILLGISNRTVEESRQDDWRFDPQRGGLAQFWETEWR